MQPEPEPWQLGPDVALLGMLELPTCVHDMSDVVHALMHGVPDVTACCFPAQTQTRVCAEGGVQAGEELFAAYINPDAPRDVRRLHLLQHYGFDCHCPKCEAGL